MLRSYFSTSYRTSSYYLFLGVQTMPEFAVSAFNYGQKHRGEAGSIWVNSMPGGNSYKTFWHPNLFGAFSLSPLDNYETLEVVNFEAENLGGEPIGYRMRTVVYVHIFVYISFFTYKNSLISRGPSFQF